MTKTSDRGYRYLHSSKKLTPAQDKVYNSIKAKPKTRQKIAKELEFTINNVCGRVKELMDEGYTNIGYAMKKGALYKDD